MLYSVDLRVYLEDYGITTLAHARNYDLEATSYWLTASDLDLGGVWHDIWNEYISGMEQGRLKLDTTPDCLLWSFKNYTGPITAAIAYDCVANHYLASHCAALPLHRALWKLRIPEKIRCFIWLLSSNRVLTWDQLKKRGFQGPSLCILCQKNEESVQHLFMDYTYAKHVFQAISEHFGTRALHNITVGTSVCQYLDRWLQVHSMDFAYLYLPFFYSLGCLETAQQVHFLWIYSNSIWGSSSSRSAPPYICGACKEA